MQLQRFATIRLTRPAPRALARWPYRATNGVEVITSFITGIEQDLTDLPVVDPGTSITFAWPYEHEKVRVAVSATVDAGPP